MARNNKHALEFNNGSLLTIGEMPFTQQGTIEFWMKNYDLANYRNPISTNGANGGNIGFRVEYDAAGNLSAIMGNDSGVYSGGYFIKIGLKPNTWNHLAVTWNVAEMTYKGYLNGAKVFELENYTSFPTKFHNIVLGCGFASSRPFNGLLDEFRIWSVERADFQIRNNYNYMLTGKEIGLTRYLRFLEGAGPHTTDLITKHNFSLGTVRWADAEVDLFGRVELQISDEDKDVLLARNTDYSFNFSIFPTAPLDTVENNLMVEDGTIGGGHIWKSTIKLNDWDRIIRMRTEG
ncbi:hypothetical protein A7K91_04920 [Paenibacillus oryzae]|uniref:LamG-like jellyroll fold domain-containing protein n=1 Tax=Paenibacillus oryzae TaxID=1844972 RepID=A0A1A5YHQ1_9BACL|nr:LamG domain-containing protein [Paenibacillus oryzae]OBR64925.1 hypothetical protein A7K91_04920 [Paenibacillus oryzae]